MINEGNPEYVIAIAGLSYVGGLIRNDSMIIVRKHVNTLNSVDVSSRGICSDSFA